MGDLLGSPRRFGGQSGQYCTRWERVITATASPNFICKKDKKKRTRKELRPLTMGYTNFLLCYVCFVLVMCDMTNVGNEVICLFNFVTSQNVKLFSTQVPLICSILVNDIQNTLKRFYF